MRSKAGRETELLRLLRAMRHHLLLPARASLATFAGVGGLILATAAPTRAQLVPSPMLASPAARSVPIQLSRFAPTPALARRRLAVGSHGWATQETYRLADGWPMLVEGAVLGAAIGGVVGASGKGTSVRTVASGVGVGALVGGAAGMGVYALLWMGRPKHAVGER